MDALAGSCPRMRCRTLRIQKKLAIAIQPPARAPKPTCIENRAQPARVRKASSARLPLMMTAKRLSSFIVIITSTDLPAGDYVHILETGGNTDEQKNIKEPGFRAKPAIKRQTEPDPDGNRQDNGDAHAGNHGKALKKLAIVTGHERSYADAAQNRYSIPRVRRICQTEMKSNYTSSDQLETFCRRRNGLLDIGLTVCC